MNQDPARRLGDGVWLDYLGLRQVRGRNRLIDVYALSARTAENALRRRPAA